jgi:hypothetical protein
MNSYRPRYLLEFERERVYSLWGMGLVGMQGLGFEGRVEVEVGGLATVGVGRVREGDVVADHAAGEIIDVVDGKEGLLLLSAKDVGLAP